MKSCLLLSFVLFLNYVAQAQGKNALPAGGDSEVSYSSGIGIPIATKAQPEGSMDKDAAEARLKRLQEALVVAQSFKSEVPAVADAIAHVIRTHAEAGRKAESVLTAIGVHEKAIAQEVEFTALYSASSDVVKQAAVLYKTASQAVVDAKNAYETHIKQASEKDGASAAAAVIASRENVIAAYAAQVTAAEKHLGAVQLNYAHAREIKAASLSVIRTHRSIESAVAQAKYAETVAETSIEPRDNAFLDARGRDEANKKFKQASDSTIPRSEQERARAAAAAAAAKARTYIDLRVKERHVTTKASATAQYARSESSETAVISRANAQDKRAALKRDFSSKRLDKEVLKASKMLQDAQKNQKLFSRSKPSAPQPTWLQWLGRLSCGLMGSGCEKACE